MENKSKLWNQFIQGDSRSLGELYEHLFEPLVFVSFYIVKNNDHARDIVGELFVQLLSTSIDERKKKWSSIDDIHLYLNKIIHNKSIDHLRKTQNRLRIVNEIPSSNVQQMNPFQEEVLNELAEQEKVILTLHMDGYNNHEIAEQFNLSEKTIRNKLSIRRKTLLNYFKSVLVLFT